jgi:hypothetical protein
MEKREPRSGLDSIIKDPESLKKFVAEQMREIRNQLLVNQEAPLTIGMVISDLSFKVYDIMQHYDEHNELFMALGIIYDLTYDIAGLAKMIKDERIMNIALEVTNRIYNSI